MAIAFDASGSLTGNGVTSLSIDITPASVGAWVFCYIGNSYVRETVTFTGWTKIFEVDEGTGSHHSLWKRKKLTGDTTFTASWGTGYGSTAAWCSYTGISETTPDEL